MSLAEGNPPQDRYLVCIGEQEVNGSPYPTGVVLPELFHLVRYFSGFYYNRGRYVVSQAVPEHFRPVVLEGEIMFKTGQLPTKQDALHHEKSLVSPQHLDDFLTIRAAFLRDLLDYSRTASPVLWLPGYKPDEIEEILKNLDLAH